MTAAERKRNARTAVIWRKRFFIDSGFAGPGVNAFHQTAAHSKERA
jgi:hypothetical protein